MSITIDDDDPAEYYQEKKSNRKAKAKAKARKKKSEEESDDDHRPPQFLESCRAMTQQQRLELTKNGVEFRSAERSMSGSKKYLIYISDWSVDGVKAAFDATVLKEPKRFNFEVYEFFLRWDGLKGIIPVGPCPECFLDLRIPWGLSQFLVLGKRLPATKIRKMVCSLFFVFGRMTVCFALGEGEQAAGFFFQQ